MDDPGENLKRVMNFRKTIIEEKNSLFQEFSTERELESWYEKIDRICERYQKKRPSF